MKRVVTGLVATLAVIAGIVATVAQGASNTEITLKAKEEAAKLVGKVKSTRNSCEAGRAVHLYWDEPGEPGGFEEVGDTETDGDGKWSIEAPGPDIPPGKYYAKAKKDGNCDGAKSDSIRVRAP